jgi:hypothetical protein
MLDMQSRYWYIDYGPEAYEEEAYCVADMIKKALKLVVRSGHGLASAVYTTYVANPYFDDQTDAEKDWLEVIGLIELEKECTLDAFRDCITSVCSKHPQRATLIRDDCDVRALDKTQYDRIGEKHAGDKC